MIIKKLNRKFRPSKKSKVTITERAKIYLKNDEQITLIDYKKNQYDIVKKSWGYYSTPSINKRLKKNNYLACIVENVEKKTFFLFLVNTKKKVDFNKYIKINKIKVIKWLK